MLLGGGSLLVPLAAAIDIRDGNFTGMPFFLAAWAALVVVMTLRTDHALTSAQRSERRFRTIFQASPAGIGISRGDRILDADEFVRSMFGYENQDALAAVAVSDHVAPDERATFRARQRLRIAGEAPATTFETTAMRADRSVFPLLLEARDIDLDDGPATVGFFLDLSDQRAARRAAAILGTAVPAALRGQPACDVDLRRRDAQIPGR